MSAFAWRQLHGGCEGDNCPLEPCPNEESQRDCDEVKTESEKENCKAHIKWCRSYEVRTVQEGEQEVGFVPLIYVCQKNTGQLSQGIGVIEQNEGEVGTYCCHGGVTLVDRDFRGPVRLLRGQCPSLQRHLHGRLLFKELRRTLHTLVHQHKEEASSKLDAPLSIL
jgi:hypothetical protein